MSRRVPPFPNVPKFVDTLANLQALGTADGVAVGDVAWDTTNKRFAHCLTATATSTWAHSEWQQMISTWWSNVTTLVYVPWGADLEHPTITSEHVSLGPMKAAGQIEEVSLYCTGSAGSTILGFHKNDNTTATVTDTQTVVASTEKTFDWGSSATFAKGDRLHVSIDPTNATLVSNLSIKVRLDW